MLSLKNVSKNFGANYAVDDVSFEIRPGEIFSLIGPNGSGKTTIIKMIAGLLIPLSGTIEVDGNNVVKKPIQTKSVIGYISDEPSAWSGMTGEEFLHFSGALWGLDEAARTEAIKSWLSVFGLAGIEKDYFENYSRGNRQKFAIIAAMMHQPKLLLIDEPIVGLDPSSAEIAKQKFSEFARQGGAVLMVTHTLGVASAIATRIGILKKGKLVISGSLEELRRRTQTAADSSLEKIYHLIAEKEVYD
jgi:ABC-2 type transport system ATP-binding protein